MKITIESTNLVTRIEGVQCRIWRGVTEAGIPCDVAVRMLRVHEDADCEQFERELQHVPEPEERLVVDFRHVW